MTFTLGRGTDLVVHAAQLMKDQLLHIDAEDILNNFGMFWRKLTSDSQMRWV